MTSLRLSRTHVLSASCLIAASATVSAQTAPNAQEEFPGEGWVVERADHNVRFENDGTGQVQASFRVRLLTQAGVREWGLIVLPYDAQAETMELREVHVLKANGSASTPPLSEIQEVTSPVARAAPIYSDYREKHFPVPDLAPGDTLEYTAVDTVRNPRAPGQFWYEATFLRSAVVLEQHLEIDVPRNRRLKLSTSAAVKPVVSETAGRRIYDFVHSMSRLDEVLAARRSARRRRERPPDVALSTFGSWEEVGAWYGALERERRVPTAEVRAKAMELTRGLATDAEKTQALYDYVSQNVRYVSLSLGLASVQPHPAGETLANGYGDCKDKHTLLSALLAAVGIPAYAALIPSSRELDETVPYLQFDHLITAVPQGGEYLWLDTTAEVGPFRWLQPRLRGKTALVVPPDGPARLARTPSETFIPNESVVDVVGRLDENGKLVAHQETTLRGDAAVTLRAVSRLVHQDEWLHVVEKQVAAMADTLNLKAESIKVAPLAPETSLDAFGWSADYSIERFVDASAAAPASVVLRLPAWMDRSPAAEELPIALDGQLELPGPGTIRVHARIDLPRGWSPRLPEPVSVSLDFADYHSTSTFQGQTLALEQVLTVKTLKLPEARSADYEKLRTQVAQEQHVFTIGRAQGSGAASAGLDTEELYKAGVAELGRRNYAGSVEKLKRVVDMEPRHKDAWNDLGRAYMGLGETDLAIAALRKQIELAPAHPSAYNTLGLALRRAGRDGEAETAFRKQAEIVPGERFPHSNLGALLLDQKRYAEAATEFERAVEIEPANAATELGLAGAYLGLRQDEKAMDALDKAVTASPQPEIWNNAAYTLAESGTHLERAQEWAESAVTTVAARLRSVPPERIGPAEVGETRRLAENWDTLGWILFLRGDAAHALTYLGAAFRALPEHVIADHLGQVLEKEGRRKEATSAYAQALALSPKNTDIRRRLVAAAGGEAQADAAASAAGASLMKLGSLPISRPAGLSQALSVELFAALGSDGKVRAARPPTPEPEADAAARALVGAGHGFAFPDATPTQIVRHANLVCAAEGDCQLAWPLASPPAKPASGTTPRTDAAQPPSATEIIKDRSDITPPRRIRNVSPDYPEAARKAGIQGTVTLECSVGIDGSVTGVRLLSGVPELNDSAIAAVRQWVYTPTILRGVAVPVIMTVTVRFSLKASGAADPIPAGATESTP